MVENFAGADNSTISLYNVINNNRNGADIHCEKDLMYGKARFHPD